MKKTFAIFIALIMVLAFSGCKSDESPAEETTKEPTEAPTEAPTQTATPEPEPVIEGTELDTEFWSIIYSDDWTYDAENDLWASEGYYASGQINIMNGEEEEISVEIDATIEGPGSYRDSLRYAGIDAYEMVENNAVEFVNVGGVDCVEYKYEYWGDTVVEYYGRDESAGVTVNVEITGDYSDQRVTDLISTLTFTLQDAGNVDPPWPWNGEPFSAESSYESMIGTYTITSQWLAIDEPVVIYDIFSGRVAVAGEKAYILSDGALMQYAYDGTSLVYEKDILLDAEYEEISAVEDGSLYLSNFMENFIQIKDGEKVYSIDGPDYVTMHPSGNWGISWFSSSDVEKITITDGIIETEEWTFEEVNIISSVSISEDHIFVGGSSVANEEQAIFVYDLRGDLELTLGDTDFGEPDSLGSITTVIETNNGFLGIDGNMRNLCFWKSDGSFIGTLEDSDLFGTYYPWMSSACLLSDGSIIIGMTEERDDSSADEFVVFRLSGF